MNEIQWVKTVKEQICQSFVEKHSHLDIFQGVRLPYANEVLEYKGAEPKSVKSIGYETDLLVIEKLNSGNWKPRLVVECKINSVTTHDAITYSEKSFAHKRVHPYLRYGILIGNRKRYPLPGRLFRHGLYFDFMASWVGFSPTKVEFDGLLNIILDEVEASINLENMLFQSRSSKRNRYVVLHKPLRLQETLDSPEENNEIL